MPSHKYSYASSGNGSILHLASEYFKREVGGIDVVHVPYRGGAPALQDLMSGQVAWMFETFSTTLQQHRAGKIRILAYAKRAAIAPEIPTMIEAGVKDYEAYTFNLILGPAGMPQRLSIRRIATDFANLAEQLRAIVRSSSSFR